MTEGLFILTTIFVAYVVYQVVNDQKKTSKPADQDSAHKVETVASVRPPAQPAVKKEAPVAAKSQPAAAKEASPPPKTQPAAKKEPLAAAKPSVAENKPAPTPTPAPASAAPAMQPASKGGLRDPKTGEVVNAYTNYRFTKRWIKEALVAEGLLAKVYKNNELNDEVEAQIKAALAKLEAMDKYRG